MRENLYKILDSRGPTSLLSRFYEYFMIVAIFVSLVPLFFRDSIPVFDLIESVVVSVFILDYLARWFTADIKLQRGPFSFLIYPFTPMAIIDLLAILPAFSIIGDQFKVLRALRILRLLRAFKLVRYSKTLEMLGGVFKKQRRPLLVVLVFVAAYVVLSALFMFNTEPQTFPSFFDAVYWSVTTLTTVGYGDIYPTTEGGRVVAIIYSLIGISIIAFPSAIITAGYMEELAEEKVLRQGSAEGESD